MKPLAKHILADAGEAEPKLVFESYISGQTGNMSSAERNPGEWDHVRQICKRLYYAWDNGREKSGAVYLAKEQP
jgi:hypothetical protein